MIKYTSFKITYILNSNTKENMQYIKVYVYYMIILHEYNKQVTHALWGQVIALDTILNWATCLE